MKRAEHAEVAPSQLARDVTRHLCEFEESIAETRCYRWMRGGSYESLPALQIVEANGTKCVHYVTAGASDIKDNHGYGLEFCLQAGEPSVFHVELLAMVAFMHCDPRHRLSVGHTLKIGRPIVVGSSLDRLLVSLPYPYGERFEFIHLSNGQHARILWLLPITALEERFRHEHGLEALEKRFDKKELNYIDFLRRSVVAENEVTAVL